MEGDVEVGRSEYVRIGLQVRPFLDVSFLLNGGGEMGVRKEGVCGEWKVMWRVEREAGIWAGRDSEEGTFLIGCGFFFVKEKEGGAGKGMGGGLTSL